MTTTAAGRGLVVLLGALAAFGPMSIDMYLPAMPAMGRALGATPGNIQLTLSAFFVGFAAGQLFYGPMSDRFGRRPVLIGGIALYVAGTLLCALATGVEALIAFRLLHAFGGGAGAVLSRAIVADRFQGDQAARVLSLTMLVTMGAPLVAPLIGGHLSVWFGWRMIFFVLTTFGLVCLVSAVIGLEESLPPGRRRSLNIGQMAGAYLTVIRHRRAAGYILCRTFVSAGMFAFLAGAPFVYIAQFGVKPENFAYLFSLNVLGVMCGSYINSRLVVRFGTRTMLRTGLTIMGISSAVLVAVSWSGAGGLVGIAIPLFCYLAPINLVTANTTAASLRFFPELAGTASALGGAGSFVGGSLSSLTLGALNNGTPMPMVAIMFTCTLAGSAAYRFMTRDR